MPFVSFNLILVDGTTYTVKNPDFIAIALPIGLAASVETAGDAASLARST